MQSGAPIPVGDITDGQRYYDAVVEEVGCSSEPDTLECLRTVDYAALYTAMNKSPNILSYQVGMPSAVFHSLAYDSGQIFQSLILAWLPRADGVFLTDNPQKLVADGSVANIPIITGMHRSSTHLYFYFYLPLWIGNCDDEGTCVES
jgi:acetylcholinesterase